MNKSVWIPIVCVVLASLIGWGAWTTQNLAEAAKSAELQRVDDDLQQHKEIDSDKFMMIQREIQRQRESIEDKLDEIQQSLPRGN